jgi:hypothetical protein
MSLADLLPDRIAAGHHEIKNLLGMLPNLAAIEAEVRLCDDGWNDFLDGICVHSCPCDFSDIRKSVQSSLGKWVLTGPVVAPRPSLLERVGSIVPAFQAMRTKGVARDEIPRMIEEFEQDLAKGELDVIKSKYFDLHVGRKPIWGTPSDNLMSRSFSGLGFLELFDRLNLGVTPTLNGDHWVFCYSPQLVDCRIPTIADACGNYSWHPPFFPSPAGEPYGITKPITPGKSGFFEVVHEPVSWECFLALPEKRPL